MDAFITAAVVHHRYGKRFSQTLKNGMGKMGRRHKVDIVRSPGNKLTVNFRQPLHGYFYPPPQFGYFIILAVHAGQIAPRKENRSRASRSADARLFPMMERRPGYDGKHACPTVTDGALSVNGLPPRHTASPRADITDTHHMSFI